MLLQHVTHSYQLVFINLDFLLSLKEPRLFDVFLAICEFFIFLFKLRFQFFDLFLQGHDQERLLLVALSRLCNWSEWSSNLILLCILYELVLLEEIFECSFFPAHFVLENFDFGFQFYILVFVHVGQLFHLDCFIVESLRFFLTERRRPIGEVTSLLSCCSCRICLLDSAFS